MIIDAKHWFSLSSSVGDIPRAVATLVSTNVLDLGAAGDAGEELYLLVQVLTTFDSAEEDATLQVKLYTDSDPAMGTQVLMFETGVIAEATLVAGYRVIGIRLPKGMKRYARLSYATATHDFTAGALHALLVPNLENVGTVLRA
jgi:hypothetical protein